MDASACTFFLIPYKEFSLSSLNFLPKIDPNSVFDCDLRITASDICKDNALVVLRSIFAGVSLTWFCAN